MLVFRVSQQLNSNNNLVFANPFLKNFEIWNNLANGFIKLGEKVKALRALKEATKCNYENWKVWENILIVATDCKDFDQVIHAYNRLLDLKGKWVDEQVN